MNDRHTWSLWGCPSMLGAPALWSPTAQRRSWRYPLCSSLCLQTHQNLKSCCKSSLVHQLDGCLLERHKHTCLLMLCCAVERLTSDGNTHRIGHKLSGPCASSGNSSTSPCDAAKALLGSSCWYFQASHGMWPHVTAPAMMTSGATHAHVPATVMELRWECPCSCADSPTSAILAVPSAAISTLLDFRSKWMTLQHSTIARYRKHCLMQDISRLSMSIERRSQQNGFNHQQRQVFQKEAIAMTWRPPYYQRVRFFAPTHDVLVTRRLPHFCNCTPHEQ